jgi:hypothetical protein
MAALEEKRAALRASGRAAEGAVEVTVDARGQLVKVAIDEDYLKDHKFDELGEHITEAARTAAADAGQRMEQMMAPYTARFGSFASLSQKVKGPADLEELLSAGFDSVAGRGSAGDGSPGDPGDGGGEHEDGGEFVTVRRDVDG